MLIGYARFSTTDQNVSLQIDELEKVGWKKIFRDRINDSKAERPGLQEALDFLRDGDSLVVWRLDRLGRSLKHLLEPVSQLEDHEIGFRSLQEAIDTTTSGGRLIFHIFDALAEFERNLIRERTMAGLKAARARGLLVTVPASWIRIKLSWRTFSMIVDSTRKCNKAERKSAPIPTAIAHDRSS